MGGAAGWYPLIVGAGCAAAKYLLAKTVRHWQQCASFLFALRSLAEAGALPWQNLGTRFVVSDDGE
jgi:hypothetical protein